MRGKVDGDIDVEHMRGEEGHHEGVTAAFHHRMAAPDKHVDEQHDHRANGISVKV